MKEILQEAQKRADSAELYLIKLEKYPVNFTGNRLKSIKSQLTRSVGLRLKHQGRLGFSSDSDPGSPEALVDRALASAKLGDDCPFDFCKDPGSTPVDLFDPRTVSFEIEEAVEMGQKMVDHIQKNAPGTVNDASITRSFIEITYMTDGVEKTYYKTLLSRSVSCMQVTDDGFIYISEGDVSCRIPDDVLSLSRRIVDKIPHTKEVHQMPSRPTTVIFHPKAAKNLINPLVAGLSGSSLVSGSSPLLGKYNRWILDQRFTLADDPTVALGASSEGFDGEGLPRCRQVLFDRGVLSNYLLDLNSAAILGLEPNACAGRELNSPPVPEASNLIVGGGDVPLKDMIQSVKDGLLVEEVIGGGQANVIAGEFSTNVSLGFKIENGEIRGRVRNTMIAGNVYELLKDHLLALSVEREAYYSLTSPYFMFRDLSVSGKS
jgi:PmbA protein